MKPLKNTLLHLVLLMSPILSAGSAVSDMLDERLRQLQQQMDESRKACDGLRGEVLAFSTAAREVGTTQKSRETWRRRVQFLDACSRLYKACTSHSQSKDIAVSKTTE